MPHNLDCVFFVERGPSIEFRDGLFHICYEVGRSARFEVVLAPSAYFPALAEAVEAGRKFGKGGRVVSILRSVENDHAASDLGSVAK